MRDEKDLKRNIPHLFHPSSLIRRARRIAPMVRIIGQIHPLYFAAAGAKRLKRESPCPVASAFLSAPVIGSLAPQPLVPGSSLKAARQ